ncbi:hypothetical protein ACSBR2_005401 [Camellia fascicularis]
MKNKKTLGVLVLVSATGLNVAPPLASIRVGSVVKFCVSLLQVDVSVNELDRRMPPVVKKASTQAFSAAQNAPTTVRSVAAQVRHVNVVDTASGLAKNAYTKCEPAAKGLYSKYEPVAEQYAASTWRSLNRLPLFPRVAQVVVPTAAYCSEKYNQTVCSTAEKGYSVASYLPLVPTEKIAKIFSVNDEAITH